MTWYSELLRDPRWQHKRLEILGAKDFTCESCKAIDKTLHVHHMYYERGAKPWEYPNEALRVLCEDCHTTIGEIQRDLSRACAFLTAQQLELLIGLARCVMLLKGHAVQFGNAIQEGGAAVFCGTTRAELLKLRSEDGTYLPTDEIRQKLFDGAYNVLKRVDGVE